MRNGAQPVAVKVLTVGGSSSVSAKGAHAGHKLQQRFIGDGMSSRAALGIAAVPGCPANLASVLYWWVIVCMGAEQPAFSLGKPLCSLALTRDTWP